MCDVKAEPETVTDDSAVAAPDISNSFGKWSCIACGNIVHDGWNQGEAYAPAEITRKSVCMNEDIGEVLKEL